VIKKRAVTPARESKGRHPMLKPGTAWMRVYQFIQKNPGCTREGIARSLAVPTTQVTGRVADLKAQDLVEDCEQAISPYSGRKVSLLRITGRNVTGNSMDKIKIIVEVFCNDHGAYYLKARIHNQVVGAERGGGGSKCLHKVILLSVTPPAKQLTNKQNMQTFAKEGLTVDGEYETLA